MKKATTIHEETKCATGPTDLWPEIKQCPNKPTRYLQGCYAEPGDRATAYCEKCYNEMLKALASFP